MTKGSTPARLGPADEDEQVRQPRAASGEGEEPGNAGPERKRLPLVRNNASAGRPDGTGALAPSRREMLAVEASLAEARRIWQGDRRGRKTRASQEQSACILPKKIRTDVRPGAGTINRCGGNSGGEKPAWSAMARLPSGLGARKA
jgi:hypothetical protein